MRGSGLRNGGRMQTTRLHPRDEILRPIRVMLFHARPTPKYPELHVT
jgi:hypothetical protein